MARGRRQTGRLTSRSQTTKTVGCAWASNNEIKGISRLTGVSSDGSRSVRRDAASRQKKTRQKGAVDDEDAQAKSGRRPGRPRGRRQERQYRKELERQKRQMNRSSAKQGNRAGQAAGADRCAQGRTRLLPEFPPSTDRCIQTFEANRNNG